MSKRTPEQERDRKRLSQSKVDKRRVTTRKREKEMYKLAKSDRRQLVLDIGTQRSRLETEHKIPANPPGPNNPCSCNSGKKYKKCCSRKHRDTLLELRAAEIARYEESKAEAEAIAEEESTPQVTPRGEATATAAEQTNKPLEKTEEGD